VALRNNDITQRNIQIALDNHLWGMQSKGKHSEIKKGDAVVFLLGISISNLDYIRQDVLYSTGFPNFTNELIDNSDFIEKFIFNVENVIFGDVTSDFFESDSEVWPPLESKTGKLNYFKNRFHWSQLATGNDVKISTKTTDSLFLSNVIRALRDKGAQPSFLSQRQVQIFLSSLNLVGVKEDEETYQIKAETVSPTKLPEGHILKLPQKTKLTESPSWVRDPKIAAMAIEQSGHLCAVDTTHNSFISHRSGKNFVEAHHLIPMEFQGSFSVSIDVPENILVLCPNCHRRFHHASPTEVSSLLSDFFELRCNALKSRGIFVSFDQLKDFYGKQENATE
jgi:hypothetical protein